MPKKILIPEATKPLEEMKSRIASEYEIINDELLDRGNFTSRENGKYGGNLGGQMTRMLVEIGETLLIKEKQYSD